MRPQMKFNTGAYLAAQAKEVLGPLNRYYTGLSIGRDPTPDDCWRHWCVTGASNRYCATNEHRFWFWGIESEDERAD